MFNEDNQLKKRFGELASRAEERGCYTYSEFLTIAEQDTLCSLSITAPYKLEGGYPLSERKLAQFGSFEICGYEEPFPICCLCIAPTSPKFADALTHRDFLGSLMGIGIKREVLGDIIISENCGYLFCLDSISGYIIEQITQVNHTTVTVSKVNEPPVNTIQLPELSQIIVASERLDAVVAAVYNLPRTDSQRLFEQEKVFVNSRKEGRVTYSPNPKDIISVRGFGRFIYEGVDKETRKGRLRANVRVF